MGKKGSKLSLVQKIFACYSTEEEKPRNGSYKQKRKGGKKLQRGESKWFVIPPLSFREPSSIEQILEDHEAGQMVLRSPFSPKASSPKTDVSAMTSCSRTSSGPKEAQSSRNEDVSATVIQSAYRGYQARKNLRSLRGVGRLQGMIRAQNTKLKTTDDVKQMQRFVRVQMQVQSQRLQRLQKQHQTKSVQIYEAGNNGDWDGSLLSKEELEARRKQKIEAAIKRERAMSYASSHQIHKSSMKSAQYSMDIRSNSHPWWWKWLEEQLPLDSGSQQNRDDVTKRTFTPPRSTVSTQAKPKPRANSNPKERVQGILQGNESRRSSFSPNRYTKHSCMRSVGDNLSQVSTASMPARKPFNRFV